MRTAGKVSKEAYNRYLKEFRDFVASQHKKEEWIRVVSRYYLGLDNVTEGNVLAEARKGRNERDRKERLCEAYYYLGEQRLLQGDREGAEEYFAKIEELGGMLKAVELCYCRREIENAAYEYQKEIEEKRRIVVGLNEYADETRERIEILKIDPAIEEQQKKDLAEFKARRDNVTVKEALARLKTAAESNTNLMPVILDCVKKEATEGEIVNVFRGVFGEYVEPSI